MTFNNPTFIDKLVEEILSFRLGGKIYRDYVDCFSLRGDERVFELGPAGGACSKQFLSRLSSEGYLTAVDTSEYWVKKAKKRFGGVSNVDFLYGDVRSLRLDSESYDFAAIHFVLHDVPSGDRQGVVGAVAHLLRSGGRLIIREPTSKWHGMSASLIKRIMAGTGLRFVKMDFGKSGILGEFCTGVFEKK